jgi:hypothetical protein
VTDITREVYQGVNSCQNVNINSLALEGKRFGDTLQSEKIISFFVKPHFWVLYANTTSDEPRLWLSSKEGSFFYTGNHSWTLYSENDYQGSAQCLKPDPGTIQRGWGVSYEPNVNLTVKSVKEGCHGVTTTTTSTEATTLKATTVESTTKSEGCFPKQFSIVVFVSITILFNIC